LPLPVMTWKDAMLRFGSDKPELRFGVELADVTAAVKDSGFGVFSGTVARGGRVRVLAVPAGSGFSRKQISDLEEVAKTTGAKGLAWFKVAASGEGEGGLEGGSSKFLSAPEGAALIAATRARPGDLLLAVADTFAVSAKALGAVRLAVGRQLGLI